MRHCFIALFTQTTPLFSMELSKRIVEIKLLFYLLHVLMSYNIAVCRKAVNPVQVDMKTLTLSILQQYLKWNSSPCGDFITVLES